MDDIHAEVLGWVLDQIGKQAFSEDYGAAVSFGAAPLQTPQGQRIVPVWTLLITARNPLLGQGPLFHGPVPIGSPRPVEADVRAAVTEGLRLLRDLAASQLAGSNGKAPAGVAKGSG